MLHRVLLVFAGNVVAEVVEEGGDGSEPLVGGEAVPGAAPDAYLAVGATGKKAVVGDG